MVWIKLLQFLVWKLDTAVLDLYYRSQILNLTGGYEMWTWYMQEQLPNPGGDLGLVIGLGGSSCIPKVPFPSGYRS